MLRRLILLLIEWLTKLTYEPLTLDKLNKKLIEPVSGLLINGQQYYKFVNVADMPPARFIHYINFNKEFSQGFSTNSLDELFDNIAKANNAGDQSQIGQLVYMGKDILNNCTPVEAMFRLASLCYFTREEDLSCYDVDLNHRKILDFKAQPNQTFFLSRLATNLTLFGEASLNEVEGYLKQSLAKLSYYQTKNSELAK